MKKQQIAFRNLFSNKTFERYNCFHVCYKTFKLHAKISFLTEKREL